MKNLKNTLTALVCLLIVSTSYGYKGPENSSPSNTTASGVSVASLRNDCALAGEQIDMAINNVRARLLAGGDVWWDGTNGRYVVPKVESGQEEVSSIYAGAVWLGGVDDGMNLKVACQMYGSNSGRTDFWPGPLTEAGETEAIVCETWDRFFTVTGTEVREHRANFAAALEAGIPYDPNDIPDGIKGWPAVGNEFFEGIEGFRLPDDNNGLAGFWDFGDNGVPDGRYNPDKGDFPIVEIRGCAEFPQTFPDEMIFWIYNDNGNIHTQSNGDPIRMEVQVQAFAFATDDEINNMTFQRYKLINRATEPINETYFAMWVDGDLGCSEDDFIGCDTTRSLAYYYNSDALDGQPPSGACGGVATYGTEIPAVGIDYFRGPLNENFEELGMSTFSYFNRAGSGGPHPPATTDPTAAADYYNYLQGNWRDGTPLTFGGTGYDPGNTNEVDFAYVDKPDEAGGWSQCEAMSSQGDRRTVQASGPFRLDPGVKNELIIGAVWIEELIYPCPNIDKLLTIDDVAQSLFDNCFEITRGPSAPDLDFIELDKELICLISNDPGNADNNNIFETYAERDLRAPSSDPNDSTFFYKFEGYQIYQLSSPNASDLSDPDQARLIREMDLKNGISTIFNWNPVDNPLDPANSVWVPEEKAAALDVGIDHSFSISEDQFATGNRSLINHRTYYFRAISYGYNNWREFDIASPLGSQSQPYISGDLNIRTYTPVPRPITNLQTNTFFGDGVEVERLEGKGNGGNFIELTDESIAAALEGNAESLVYKPGQAPITVKIVNPLEVVDGYYEVSFSDNNPTDDVLSKNALWTLTNLDNPSETFEGERPFEFTYEQIIQEIGVSITSGDVEQVGALESNDNGAIGAELDYDNPEVNEWLNGLTGNEPFANFIPIEPITDPFNGLTGESMAPNLFNPFLLARPPSNASVSPQIDDATIVTLMNAVTGLDDLNNVDIVFTSDKSKWSRCMVIETSSRWLTDANEANLDTEGDARHFNTRRAPSVTMNAGSDGRPEVDPNESREGFGWFPGYAIDVETGQRLNIFFGEASVYDCAGIPNPDDCSFFLGGENGTGRDMMFNPTPQGRFMAPQFQQSIAAAIVGGHHWVYVTRSEYDGCESLYDSFNEANNPVIRRNGLAQITWAGALSTNVPMNSYADGLIPEDLTYRLRVSTPLDVDQPSATENNGNPRYRFRIEGKSPQDNETEEEIDEQLAQINIVPNPYYGFSNYEALPTSTIIKLTNLPNQCTINIFSLEGKFIRSYNRNVGPNVDLARGGILAKQTEASLDWDLKNSKGIPVASGTYLVNVVAPNIGERTLKIFMVQRQFDPTGL